MTEQRLGTRPYNGLYLRSREVVVVVTWCFQSTTTDLIRAENKLESISKLFIPQAIIPHVSFSQTTTRIIFTISERKPRNKTITHVLEASDFLRTLNTGTPQKGAADAEIKVPSVENTELKGSLFKAWSRSVDSHACYVYCQGFAANFYRSGQFICIFLKPIPNFSCINCGQHRFLRRSEK